MLIYSLQSLKEYESRTRPLRRRTLVLFLRVNQPVGSSTIARWLNVLLRKAGVNTKHTQYGVLVYQQQWQQASQYSLKQQIGAVTPCFKTFTTSRQTLTNLVWRFCPHNSYHPGNLSYNYTLICEMEPSEVSL